MNINLKKISSFLIPIIPLLSMYQINFLFNGLSELITFLVFIFFVIMHFGHKCDNNTQGNKYIRRSFILLFVLILASTINLNANFNYRNIIYYVMIFLILYGVNRDCIDYKLFKKVYWSLAIICTIYIICQFIFVSFFNIYLPPNILPFDTSYLFDANNEVVKLGVLRLQSFFSEPSLYAQYILPIYLLILFSDNKKKKEYLTITLFVIGALLSTSTLGVLSISIGTIYYLFNKYKKNIAKIIICFVIFLPLGISIISSNQYIDKSIQSILFESNSSTKLTIRFFRGFSIYSKLPFEKQIFGIGVGNGEYYIDKYEITTDYETAWHSEGVEYYNNIAASLMYGGILAGIFYCMAQLSFIRSKSSSSKLLSCTYFIISFASSSFFNAIYLLYGVNMLEMDKEKSINKGCV